MFNLLEILENDLGYTEKGAKGVLSRCCKALSIERIEETDDVDLLEQILNETPKKALVKKLMQNISKTQVTSTRFVQPPKVKEKTINEHKLAGINLLEPSDYNDNYTDLKVLNPVWVLGHTKGIIVTNNKIKEISTVLILDGDYDNRHVDIHFSNLSHRNRDEERTLQRFETIQED